MAIKIKYKTKGRSWCQAQLTDWFPQWEKPWNEFLEVMRDWRWELKKAWHQKLKEKGVRNLPKLRRGRIGKIGPTRKCYDMSVPAHVAEVRKFKWFSKQRAWKRRKKCPVLAAGQQVLDRWHPDTASRASLLYKPVIPRFRKPRVVLREEFCGDISDLAWAALHGCRGSKTMLFYIFYLNDFSIVDDDDLLSSPEWRSVGRYLASDIVKYELARLLLGFSTFSDYFRMTELFPDFEDHLAIAMARHPPSGGRHVKALRLIGAGRIRKLFYALVSECRALGLIKDRVWAWDGQFFETWLKTARKKGSRSKADVWGGWYNHGGRKVGFGVVQSVIVDWSGTVPLPIEVRVYPANRNENIIFRETFKHCISSAPLPALFLAADKGPSGSSSLNLVRFRGMVPVMALGENRKRDVLVTYHKQYHFDRRLVSDVDPSVLERVYMMRTRIEEMFSQVRVSFKLTRLRGAGRDFIKAEILLVNILHLLVALTAFKIGRPDLMWRPSAFDNLRLHPSVSFPSLFSDLEKLRDD